MNKYFLKERQRYNHYLLFVDNNIIRLFFSIKSMLAYLYRSFFCSYFKYLFLSSIIQKIPNLFKRVAYRINQNWILMLPIDNVCKIVAEIPVLDKKVSNIKYRFNIISR